MTGFEIGLLVGACSLTAWAVGVFMGAAVERKAWVMRAFPKNGSPHFCNGEFYYIVPEKIFCEEFQRRETEESK